MAEHATPRQIVKTMALSFIMANNLSRFDGCQQTGKKPEQHRNRLLREQPRM